MFGLFRRAHTAGVGSRGRAVLRLEALDGRDLPSSSGMGPALTAAPPVAAGATPNQAPEIINFAAREVGNGLFLVSGQVVDENPGGLTVTLGGTTSAAGKTA